MGFHMAVTDLEGGRHARGARDAARRGRHQLQALHGLQGRAHGRRRDALPDDAGRRRDRRARDGARRERRRDRRARQGGARRGQHRAALPRAHAAAGDRGRGDEPRDPARTRRRLHRSTSSTSRARSRSSRSRSRARRAGTSGARRARSTSSSTTRTSSGPTSRARSTSTRRRRARRRTRRCSGTRSAPTSSRSSRPTTAPFLWDGQKTMGKDDFSKIPNGAPGLEDRLQMIHEFGVRAGRISLNRMVELLCDEPGEAVRPLPAQGHDRGRLGRGHRRLRPGRRSTRSRRRRTTRSRDYNLFEGTEVTGAPEIVLLRGRVLVEDGELVASARRRPVRPAREVRRGAEAEPRSPSASAGSRGRPWLVAGSGQRDVTTFPRV